MRRAVTKIDVYNWLISAVFGVLWVTAAAENYYWTRQAVCCGFVWQRRLEDHERATIAITTTITCGNSIGKPKAVINMTAFKLVLAYLLGEWKAERNLWENSKSLWLIYTKKCGCEWIWGRTNAAAFSRSRSLREEGDWPRRFAMRRMGLFWK